MSASFPSLIALLAGGGTRSFSDTDGEEEEEVEEVEEAVAGVRKSKKKMADLCLLFYPPPPSHPHLHWGVVCVDTDTWS